MTTKVVPMKAKRAKIIAQEYEPAASIDSVQPHPNNPRRGDVKVIEESIEENGFYGTVIAQRSTGYILAGEHRWRAMKAQGEEVVPVMWADVNDKVAKRILSIDNRASDLASWDFEQLSELLQGLQDEDNLRGSGYTEDDLTQLLESMGDQDLGEEDEHAGPSGGFGTYDEGIKTDHECPKCGYKFSGGDKSTGKKTRKRKAK